MKKVLLLMLSATLLLGSCSKSDDAEPEPKPETCLVTSLEYLIDGESEDKETYTYDDKGRIIKVDQSGDVATLTYSTGKITITFDGDQEVYILDANDRITKVDDLTYTYNTDGYLVKEESVSKDYPFTRTYTYTDGNLAKTEFVHSYQNGSDNYNSTETTVFSYNNETAGSATPGLWLEYEGALAKFLGKMSKNLLIKKVSTNIETKNGVQLSKSEDTHAISYKKDSKGNISSITDTYSGRDGNYTTTINVSYNCE